MGKWERGISQVGIPMAITRGQDQRGTRAIKGTKEEIKALKARKGMGKAEVRTEEKGRGTKGARESGKRNRETIAVKQSLRVRAGHVEQ